MRKHDIRLNGSDEKLSIFSLVFGFSSVFGLAFGLVLGFSSVFSLIFGFGVIFGVIHLILLMERHDQDPNDLGDDYSILPVPMEAG